MIVKDILPGGDRDLVTIRPEDTAEMAAAMLTSNNIGAIPVRDQAGHLVGIISERDIVRNFSAKGIGIHAATVADLMTRNVATCGLTDNVKDVMRTMSRRHIRHLPVLEDGKLSAMVSLRDVMKAVLEETELERNMLWDIATVATAGN